MFDAVFINGLNGLQAQEERLGAISDNIANVKTTGYKRVDILFSTLMGDTNDPSPTLQTSSVKSKPFRIASIPGEITTNTVDTNVALQGKGFFVVNTQADGSGETYFTRDGSFEPNVLGTFANKSGHYLMGFPTSIAAYTPAVETAALSNTASSTSALRNVRIPRETVLQAAAGTTTAAITGTIPPVASQTVGTTRTNLLTVTDGSGNSHDITLTYTVTASGYTLSGASGDGTVSISSGTSPITAGSSTPLTVTANWTTPSTSTSTISLSLSGLNHSAIQFTARAAATDGNIDGYLQNFNITSAGLINAYLTNGNAVTVGQIAVANFPSVDNLQAIGGNAFRMTELSGNPTISSATDANTDSAAVIGSAIEGSNVDLAEELANLIGVQRSYSFNSTVLKTADEMTKTVTELKR